MKTGEIRQYIAEKLGELEIGIVHSRNRVPKKREQFNALFSYDGKIQAWIVTRGSIGTPDIRAHNFLKIPQTFTIITFTGFNDELNTEDIFEEHLNAAFLLFARDTTLGGHVAQVIDISVPEIQLVSIGETISHYAEIILTVIEFTA